MNLLDVVIIVGYLISLLIFGIVLGKTNKSQEDYFLANRKIPWYAVGLSIMATMLSASSFVAGPGWAYSSGLGPFVVNMTVPLSVFFVLYTMVPVYYHLNVTSVYEYVGMRFGNKTRMLSVIGFIVNSLIQVSSFVFIPALIIRTLTGWNIIYIVIGIVLISIFYTITGGIKAVIWTDTLQMILMWVGLFIILYIIFKEINVGFFETVSMAKEAGKFESFSFEFNLGSTYTIWVGLLGGFVMWTRYFGFDQGQVQRVLTSSSMKDIKESYVLSSIAMNVVYVMCLLVGIFLYILYDGRTFESSNEIMINFIIEYIPVGVLGIIISSIFGAAMSSVDSLLNSLTTVFVKDIYEPFFGRRDVEADLPKVMMISCIWGVIIVLFTIMGYVGTTKSVLDVVGKYISYISGPMFGIIMLGMFTQKSNDNGVFSGAILGSIVVLIFSNTLNVSWLWNPLIGGLSTILFGYGLSRVVFKKVEECSEYSLSGIRKSIKLENRVDENGVSTMPLKIDKYGYIILGFFILQMAVLFIIK